MKKFKQIYQQLYVEFSGRLHNITWGYVYYGSPHFTETLGGKLYEQFGVWYTSWFHNFDPTEEQKNKAWELLNEKI
jgi:hypothetical protein